MHGIAEGIEPIDIGHAAGGCSTIHRALQKRFLLLGAPSSLARGGSPFRPAGHSPHHRRELTGTVKDRQGGAIDHD